MGKKVSNDKALWIVLVVIAVCSFIVNVVLSCVYSNINANIFTAISGWVSGLATFFVGVIAYKQSKQYTFESKRREMIDRIEAERRDFILEFLEIVKYNQYSDALIVLCNSFQVSTKLSRHYDYTFKVSELRDKLVGYRNVVQTYSYIPDNMVELYNKTTEMGKLISADFGLQDAYSQKSAFDADIVTATKAFVKWGEEMHTLKKQCINEINEIIEKINNVKNILDLDKLYKSISEKTLDMRRKIEKEGGVF